MNSNLDLKLIDIKLLTNIDTKVSFTKSLIHHPELLDPKIIQTYSVYPYFSKDVYYSYEKLKKLSYQKIYNLFFTRNEFQKKIKFYSNEKYKRINYPPTLKDLKDKNLIEKYKTEVAYENITTMLKLFFPTIYPFTNNVSESYTLVKNESTNYDMSPFKKKFSYLKLNNKVFTISNVVWLNDLLNNPIYQSEKGEAESTNEENKDDDNFVGLLNIVYDYLSWGEGERERIKEKIEVTKNNLINKGKSFDKIGVLNEIEGYLQVIKSNSISNLGQNPSEDEKYNAEKDECGNPRDPMVKQKCKILRELRKMITDIDNTNVILQDDKYYLVPFISNKNIEDYSEFKDIINSLYINDTSLDPITAEQISDVSDFNVFKDIATIQNLAIEILEMVYVARDNALSSDEREELRKEGYNESFEKENYKKVILDFLFKYSIKKNKFEHKDYGRGDTLKKGKDEKMLISRIENEFLRKQNTTDKSKDFMRANHDENYADFNTSDLSFFVKKMAKDDDQEDYKHKYIIKPLTNKSDFIYIDEIEYEELNRPVLFTIFNKFSGEYDNIANFISNIWKNSGRTRILFFKCKLTKNNKYQLYPFNNDPFTKNILDVFFSLKLNQEFESSTAVNKKQILKDLLNKTDINFPKIGSSETINSFAKEAIKTFFSTNNYKFSKMGDEVFIDCPKEEFYKRAAIMNNDPNISEIVENKNITLERVQLRNEQIINYYETNLPILRQYVTQGYRTNQTLSDTLQPMRFEITNKDFAEWIELTKKEIKDIRLLKRFENDYLKCQGSRGSFCTRIYVNDDTKWDENRFGKFLKVKEKYKKFMNSNMSTSNKELQKMIDNYGNNNDNNYLFVDFVKSIYESAIVNNEIIPKTKLPDKEINYIDLLNIGYNEIKRQSRNLPEISIDVQMDLIEGEINKKNVKKIKCPFCDEKLAADASKLFFNKESVRIWKVENYPFVVLNEETNMLEEKQKKEKIIESKKIEQKNPIQKQQIPNQLPSKVPLGTGRQVAPQIKAGMNIMKKNIKLKPQRQLRGKKKFKRSMKITKRNNKKNKTIKRK